MSYMLRFVWETEMVFHNYFAVPRPAENSRRSVLPARPVPEGRYINSQGWSVAQPLVGDLFQNRESRMGRHSNNYQAIRLMASGNINGYREYLSGIFNVSVELTNGKKGLISHHGQNPPPKKAA